MRLAYVVIWVLVTQYAAFLEAYALDVDPLNVKETPRHDDLEPRLVVESGHTDEIWSLDCSSSGKLLLTASSDDTVRLWEVSTGHEIRRFQHPSSVYCAKFAPNGEYFLSGCEDGILRYWHINNATPIRTFEHGTRRVPGSREVEEYVSDVTFSADGKRAFSCGYDGGHLWDIELGERRWRTDFEEVTHGTFSLDGQRVFGSTEKGTIRCWNIQSGNVVDELEGHTGSIEDLLLSIDGNELISAGYHDKTIRFWNIETFEEMEDQRINCTAEIRSLDLSNDNKTIVVLGNDNRISLFERSDSVHASTYEFGGTTVLFSDDSRNVFLGSSQGDVSLMTLETESILKQFGKLTPRVTLAAFANDGKLIAFGNAQTHSILIWDLVAGCKHAAFNGVAAEPQSAVFSPSNKFLYSISADRNRIHKWNLATGMLDQWTAKHPKSEEITFQCLAVSNDGNFVIAGTLKSIGIWRASDGSFDSVLIPEAFVDSVAVVPNSNKLLATSSEEGVMAKLIAFDDRDNSLRLGSGAFGARAVACSPNGKLLAAANSIESKIDVWRIDGELLRSISTDKGFIRSLAFSHDSRHLVVGGMGSDISGDLDESARIYNVFDSSGRSDTAIKPEVAGVWSISSSKVDSLVVTGADDGSVFVWNLSELEDREPRHLFQLIPLQERGWLVVGSDGRFDTDQLHKITGLHWTFHDSPDRSFPPEIFMRDYLETRYVEKRLVNQTLPPIRPLQDLNRVQPKVGIVGIERIGESDEVEVTVEVSGASDEFGLGDQKRTMSTGVYDLRLFRDGQIVGQSPPTAADAALPTIARTEEEREQWRLHSKVCSSDVQRGQVNFSVKLPRTLAGEKIEFTAYAFNRDRVKSETAEAFFTIPCDLKGDTRKAYLIGIGVDVYEGNGRVVRNLNYAAADARLMLDDLKPRFKKLNYQVHTTALVSAREQKPGELPATKARIRDAILDLKQQATPDDLLLLMFSSHGYTDPDNGEFYLFPHDLGEENQNLRSLTAEARLKFLKDHCVSAQELSVWLRDVDAGELVMIVDTCHAAAAIEGKGDFKPGPMGSRGLGQLAYDKGMRILTASQAGDVAIESKRIRQGLLTYALVRDGLEQDRADLNSDSKITLSEWLQYGERRVPGLFQEVLSGTVKGTDATTHISTDASKYTKQADPIRDTLTVQKPRLFQYRNDNSRLIDQ